VIGYRKRHRAEDSVAATPEADADEMARRRIPDNSRFAGITLAL